VKRSFTQGLQREAGSTKKRLFTSVAVVLMALTRHQVAASLPMSCIPAIADTVNDAEDECARAHARRFTDRRIPALLDVWNTGIPVFFLAMDL
jgi:hypothetical protein